MSWCRTAEMNSPVTVFLTPFFGEGSFSTLRVSRTLLGRSGLLFTKIQNGQLSFEPKCPSDFFLLLLEHTPAVGTFQKGQAKVLVAAVLESSFLARMREDKGEIQGGVLGLAHTWALLMQMGLVFREEEDGVRMDSQVAVSAGRWTRAVVRALSREVDLLMERLYFEEPFANFRDMMLDLYDMAFFREGINIESAVEEGTSQVITNNIFTAYYGIGFLQGPKLYLLSYFWRGAVRYWVDEESVLAPQQAENVLRFDKWWKNARLPGPSMALELSEEQDLLRLLRLVPATVDLTDQDQKATSIVSFFSPLSAFNMLLVLLALYRQPESSRLPRPTIGVVEASLDHGLVHILSYQTNPLGFRMREAMSAKDPLYKSMAEQVNWANKVQ